jgi:hypothetical protein
MKNEELKIKNEPFGSGGRQKLRFCTQQLATLAIFNFQFSIFSLCCQVLPNGIFNFQFSIFSLCCQVLPNGIFNFQLALLGAAERNF